jgi:hypothetical protein
LSKTKPVTAGAVANRIREHDRRRKKLASETLSDAYVRSVLCKGTIILKPQDFPPEMVELKRNQLRLLRAIRKHDTGGNQKQR